MSRRTKEQAYQKSMWSLLGAFAVAGAVAVSAVALTGNKAVADEGRYAQAKEKCEEKYSTVEASKVRKNSMISKCVRNALAARKI